MDKIDQKFMISSIEELKKSWNDGGSHPGYHKRMQEALIRDWPVLAGAIQKLISLNK